MDRANSGKLAFFAAFHALGGTGREEPDDMAPATVEPSPHIVRPILAGTLLAPKEFPALRWMRSMSEFGKNHEMVAGHPALRRPHVRPAVGLALLTAMAICTSASVFASFGVLVWRLVF
jgi:hypothetical protein